MKKVLFGTTALVLSAGVAFADAHAGVSVSGSAEFAVGEMSNGEITFAPDIVISFAGSGETDAGLGFGFDYGIANADSAGLVKKDNWEVYLSGTWGKLTIGDPDNGLQKVAGLGDIGFNGLGVDNRAEQERGNGNNSGLLYSGTFGPASVHVSSTLTPGASTADNAFGISFNAGDITIGVGMEENGVNDNTAVDLAGSLGGVGFDVYYEDSDIDGSNYGVIVSYDAGAATVNLGYADGESALGDAAMGVGFSMDLGGGAKLGGGIADDGTDTNWDLGISMSF